jgi:calcium-dependent protein kinase
MGCVITKKKEDIIEVNRRAPHSNTNSTIKSPVKIQYSTFVRKLNKHPDEFYEKIEIIGQGSYGKVYLVKKKENDTKRFAMKVIKQEYIEYIDSLKEINVLKTLDHINIIKIYEYFHDTNFIYIISEFCSGGELYSKLRTIGYFDENSVRIIMRQVLSAVFYCHSKNIIHRDLKPQNILIEDLEELWVKIIDFGTCEIFNKHLTPECTGTLFYMAPEIVNIEKYNEKCDMWSCGVTMYYLLSGELPFIGLNEKEVIERIKKMQPNFKKDLWLGISDEARDLISKLLVKNPKKRISAEDALKHPFVKMNSVEKNTSKISLHKICDKVEEFKYEKLLQNVVMAFIVRGISKSKEFYKLKNTFNSLDQNSDGRLSKDELIEEFKKIMEEDKAIESVSKFFNFVNNNETYISYEEFLRATIDRNVLLSRQNLISTFTVFDINKDGKICVNDLKNILNIEADLVDCQWKKIISDCDENNDGGIDLSEFLDLMADA